MNNSNKDQIGCDVLCRNHTARTERDLYRICPSKLSKRELEDLYFSLLENNLDLKKTVNLMQDKIKVLNTRLQKISVTQKNVPTKEKDCCASKAVINQQKNSIIDLKKTNERMAERIRLLNMRLCSVKQFLKRSPSQVNNSAKICSRCSIKNSSASALTTKPSESIGTNAAVSYQYLDKAVSAASMKTADAETEKETEDSDKPCNENKCRTMMDELKEKIVNLQEELATSHTEYSQRIAKLESQVLQLQDENLRVRSDHVTSEHALKQRVKKADLLQEQLRTVDAKYNDLKMELTIEKKKVAELETGLKLASASNEALKNMKEHEALKEEKPQVEHRTSCFSCTQNNSKDNSEVPASLPKTKEVVRLSLSDDSGYTDLNKSCETDDETNQNLVKMNQELLKKMAELQTELDILKIAHAGNAGSSALKMPKEYESFDVETKNPDGVRNDSGEDEDSVAMEVIKTFDELQDSNPKIEVVGRESVETKLSILDPDPNKTWEYYMIDQATENDTKEPAENNLLQAISNSALHMKSDVAVRRDDDHNRYQIPGPIPVESTSANLPIKDKRKLNKALSSCERFKTKNSSAEEKTVKIFDNRDSALPENIEKHNTEPGRTIHPILNFKEYSKDEDEDHRNNTDRKTENVAITDVAGSIQLAIRSRDSIQVNRKKLESLEETERIELLELPKLNDTMSAVKESSLSFLHMDSACTHPISTRGKSNVVEHATQSDDHIDNYEICESRAVICRCPLLERRDVAVFRSCSGTQRFRTTSTSEKLRRCACRLQTDSSVSNVAAGPARRDSETFTADLPHTYTVNKLERATSPENTEQEISSLSDLPSEKTKPPQSLSSGEEKGTMTFTDSEHVRSDKSYSEGEMPMIDRACRLSPGERHQCYPNTIPSGTASQKMEATLQTISEELARCRQLLMRQRPQEKDSRRSVACAARELEYPLHESAANRRIVDTPTPTCVFTLHIGTMVLSDEAVLYSKNKSMSLMWQFYKQNATMTRVKPGRVSLFDFTTEYEVVFNNEFLNYMMQADMPIVLSEMDKHEKAFATCSLPLREALLHANRRADMSLAMVSNMMQSNSDLSFGDEAGVLDLWCTLKVNAAHLPLINNIMNSSNVQRSPGVNPLRSERGSQLVAQNDIMSVNLSQTIPSDTPSEIQPQPRISDARCLRYQSEENTSKDASSRYDDECQVGQIRSELSELVHPSEDNVADEGIVCHIVFGLVGWFDPLVTRHMADMINLVEQYRPGRAYRRHSSPPQKASFLEHKGQKGFEKTWTSPTGIMMRQGSSGIIVNEVPTKIKSTNEMKQALDRNVQQNIMTKLPKMDDKSYATRNQLSKSRWPKNKTHKEQFDSMQDMLKKEKVSSIAGGSTMNGSYGKEDSQVNKISTSVAGGSTMNGSYGKEDSQANKISTSGAGLSKLVEASKKSVKYTDGLASESSRKNSIDSDVNSKQSIDISILWLALNEECEAMVNPDIQRLYVAFSFLGRRGADLETPFSLPKPKHYADKCYFNFKKTFNLHECDLPLLGHMSRCRAGGSASPDPRDCIVFTVVSEPPEDPLGLSSCEDIGFAYLYLGDVLAYSGGSGGYTEVVGVHGVRGGVCGVLAVRVDNLPVLRHALSLSHSHRDLLAGSTAHTVPIFELPVPEAAGARMRADNLPVLRDALSVSHSHRDLHHGHPTHTVPMFEID